MFLSLLLTWTVLIFHSWRFPAASTNSSTFNPLLLIFFLTSSNKLLLGRHLLHFFVFSKVFISSLCGLPSCLLKTCPRYDHCLCSCTSSSDFKGFFKFEKTFRCFEQLRSQEPYTSFYRTKVYHIIQTSQDRISLINFDNHFLRS